MSSDMLDLCHRYMNLHVSLYHDYFFDKPDGKRYTSDDLYYCINHFKKKTGFNKSNFRSYCFRHMFATENLIKWINNSEDITMLFTIFISLYGPYRYQAYALLYTFAT